MIIGTHHEHITAFWSSMKLVCDAHQIMMSLEGLCGIPSVISVVLVGVARGCNFSFGDGIDFIRIPFNSLKCGFYFNELNCTKCIENIRFPVIPGGLSLREL